MNKSTNNNIFKCSEIRINIILSVDEYISKCESYNNRKHLKDITLKMVFDLVKHKKGRLR